GPYTDLFDVVDQKYRIYSKNRLAAAALPDFGPPAGPVFGPGRRPPANWTASDVQKEADRVVLSRYAPVGVVIDENMTVLQFRGKTGPYLEPSPGLASLD